MFSVSSTSAKRFKFGLDLVHLKFVRVSSEANNVGDDDLPFLHPYSLLNDCELWFVEINFVSFFVFVDLLDAFESSWTLL